jgi:UDP:flavonoid glycosyltransferase YjiC (YdhE family)
VRFDSALYSPWLVVATGGPSLEYPRSDLGAQFHFVGRLALPAAVPADHPAWWPDLLATTTPVVLVTQGTFNTEPGDLIGPSLEALSEEPVLVLATADVAAPANGRTAAFLPFAELLPMTDVVITNGGWGGVLEALTHGIPLIVAGGDLDKPEIAARVAWSRAGIDLHTGKPTVRAIAKAYATVSGDPSFAERARVIATELASLGGTTAAANLIDELLATGEPVRRTSSPWA